MVKKTNNKHHLHLALPLQSKERLDRLRAVDGETGTGVIRRALLLYEESMTCIRGGGTVVFEDADGTKSTLKMV